MPLADVCRFIAQTGAILAAILRRPLSERYRVVFLDGLQLGDHQVAGAVGVTEAGEKRVLGLWEGVTENRELCQALVEDLAARGLSAEQRLWVVIDGSKALAAAVRAVCGERALVQRCVCHKARNVLEKLPRSMQGLVKRRLARAWGEPDAAAAALSLQALADRLEEAGYAQAAASLLRAEQALRPLPAARSSPGWGPRWISTCGVNLPHRRREATRSRRGLRLRSRPFRLGKGCMAATRRHGGGPMRGISALGCDELARLGVATRRVSFVEPIALRPP